MYSPVLPEVEEGGGSGSFNGYSLPDGEYASELTLRKQTPLGGLALGGSEAAAAAAAGQATFGGAAAAAFDESASGRESVSALEQLLSEMGYLGDFIVGK